MPASTTQLAVSLEHSDTLQMCRLRLSAMSQMSPFGLDALPRKTPPNTRLCAGFRIVPPAASDAARVPVTLPRSGTLCENETR